MHQTVGLPGYLEEAPIIEINGGVAVARYVKARIDRAMSVRTLARTTERCRRALERHAAGEDNIIVDD